MRLSGIKAGKSWANWNTLTTLRERLTMSMRRPREICATSEGINEASGNQVVLPGSAMSDSASPWTVARQAPLSLESSRQEYWNGLPFPSPGNLPAPGIKPRSPAMQADFLPRGPPGKPPVTIITAKASFCVLCKYDPFNTTCL